MNVHPVTIAGLERRATPLLAVPVFDGAEEWDGGRLPAPLAESVRTTVPSEDVRGKEGATLVLYPGGEGPRRLALVGAGARDALTAEKLRRFAGSAVRAAESARVDRLTVLLDAPGIDAERAVQSLVEGAALAAWRFRELKGSAKGDGTSDDSPTVSDMEIVVPEDAGDAVDRGVRAGTAVARAENLARTLQSRPGNVATPTHLADEASRLGSEMGLTVTALGPARLREEGMRALLAVSQGSDQEPRLIVMEHRGGAEGERPLVLVGKGLTFDAGGISIKPAKGMEEMKYDMSGGAAVIAAMHAIAELALPVNVVGIVPSSENLLGASALKPGDIIRTRSGKTVEVVNTDAEGRLILSDALDYALSFDPAAIVDCATLTGAVVIGLGHHAAAVLGTDDALVGELQEAGEVAGERCWPLPLWDEYRKQLDSDAADLMNVGGRPAGTITAAAFLREFVKDASWAHLDIAGTAYGTEPLSYQRKGGYGFPTRLLVEWVRSRCR